MSNIEQMNSRELIEQAIASGLLDSNMTINCVHCDAIFPKEYNKCPQCNIEQLCQSKKI